MNSINIKLIFIIWLTVAGFASPLFAAQQTSAEVIAPQEAFEKGKKSFAEENYTAAVKEFEKAEEQGMKSPALYYNLASSYYMLEEYENSRAYYKKVREYKNMQYLADYNIGLIALNQNDENTAKKLFSTVAKNSNDKKLVSLAQGRLKKVKPSKSPAWVTKKWTAYLSASLGYDDNVNFAPLGISNEVSSTFSEFIASGDYLFSGDRKNGWLGDAYFYSLKYYDIDVPDDAFTSDLFDEYEFGAGIKRYLQLNRDWQTLYSLNMSKINYGGEDYQTITKIGAEARNTLSRNERIYLRYSYENINSDNTLFDYLEGSRQKLRAEYRLFRKQDKSRIYYELELNNRNDISPGNPPLSTGTFSYSPTRHTVRGMYTSILSPEWHITGDLAYRTSDYPTTADQDRQDDRYKAAVYADYRFARDLKLRAKVEYTDNSSTEDVFTYKRTIYTLGLSALF